MEQSNLDDALEIAKTLRNAILEDGGTIGSQFLSFYTISQILGKKENMEWAEIELDGYKKGIDVPNYRKSVFANISLGNKMEKVTSNAIM
ncbi:MAG: hypothetical protein Q8Q69_05590, partial [Nitrosopumilaceae archaeon]|nr:hypothetical protein [Nitrosopumilaceae archaeon]